MIELNNLSANTVEFAYECLKELRGSLSYSMGQFQDYVLHNNLFDHPQFSILVGNDLHVPVGILTCNRFAMPRYLGFGYELEEVVVHEQFQGKGYGKLLIEAFLDKVKTEKNIRKVIVKTDDQVRAGKLYEQYFEVANTSVYSKAVNYL